MLRRGEGPALAVVAYFFCLLCGYYVLRPLRDEMGIAGGVRNLQWLFTATFFVMLAGSPRIRRDGRARLPRRRFSPAGLPFFAANIVIFWLLLTLDLGKVQGRARVLRLDQRVQSVRGIGVLVVYGGPVREPEQGKRLFGFIAAGGSAGALLGPALTVGLALPLVRSICSLSRRCSWKWPCCARGGWSRWSAWRSREASAGEARRGGRSLRIRRRCGGLGGGWLAGIAMVLRSPYLAGIALGEPAVAGRNLPLFPAGEHRCRRL